MVIEKYNCLVEIYKDDVKWLSIYMNRQGNKWKAPYFGRDEITLSNYLIFDDKKFTIKKVINGRELMITTNE